MNNQQVFNQVKEHLLKQNAKSGDEMNWRYRDHEGLKCAIGCLIPDNLYTEKIENIGIDQIIDCFSEFRLFFDGVNPKLLEDLQEIHDCKKVEEWEMELMKLATEWELAF